jgi:hypothetical protein
MRDDLSILSALGAVTEEKQLYAVAKRQAFFCRADGCVVPTFGEVIPSGSRPAPISVTSRGQASAVLLD